MRVALFHFDLRGGGSERVTVNLAKGLLDWGIEVDVVLAKSQGPFTAYLPKQARLFDLGMESSPPVGLPQLVGRLATYLRNERPEVLITHVDHYNFVPLIARWVSGISSRVIACFHTDVGQRSQSTPTLRAKLIPFFVRLSLPRFDAVVSVSDGVAESLSQIGKFPRERIHVIYNPIVTPELFAKAEEPLDHPWFQPGNPPVVLGVGRLSEPKDFSTLIRAFALVRKEQPARLMILGEGEDRPKLEGLVRELGIEDDVALPGFAENPFKYMKRAAVFVLSSKWEGFGNVLVEAMACGTPVVSTNCPSGPAEILERGKWGKLVPVGDVEALAKAISEVLTKGCALDAARRTRNFTLDVVIKQYMEVMEIGVVE